MDLLDGSVPTAATSKQTSGLGRDQQALWRVHLSTLRKPTGTFCHKFNWATNNCVPSASPGRLVDQFHELQCLTL